MKMLKKFSLIFHSLKFSLIIILLNEVISQDFQSITPKILTTGTSLMDVKDYENINLIITKKEIFTGLNPEKKENSTRNFHKVLPLLHSILNIFLLLVLIKLYLVI